MASKAKTEVATTGKGSALQKVAPMHVMSPFEEMERMMENFLPRSWSRPAFWERPFMGGLAMPFEGRMPRIDVIDRDEEILVRAEVPGVDKKDLEISVSENTVTITGKTNHEDREEKGSYCRCEVTHGVFSRTVALPGDVDADKAKTRLNEGMLELTLPKVAKSKRHTIKLE
ncbi:MAG: Hsp20/alpha crystallin family protein [Betaproteobacteria bacterium]